MVEDAGGDSSTDSERRTHSNLRLHEEVHMLGTGPASSCATPSTIQVALCNIADQESDTTLSEFDDQFVGAGTPTVSYRRRPIMAETGDVIPVC